MMTRRHSTTRTRRAGQMVVWVLAVSCAFLVAPRAYADLSLAPEVLAAGLASVTVPSDLSDVPAPAHSCIVPDEQSDASVAEPIIDLHKVAALLIPSAADRSRAGMPIAADGLPQGQAGQQVKNLPPPPSSLTVALSSLATFGAWRLVRNAKQVHIGSLPEWYHTGGPDQVGHATPFLLDLNPSMLPLCWYEPPISLARTTNLLASYKVWRSYVPRLRSQFFVSTTAPRSPPVPC